ncbi:hypothetical protein F2Q68_00046341, partial [Brassica cretica]
NTPHAIFESLSLRAARVAGFLPSSLFTFFRPGHLFKRRGFLWQPSELHTHLSRPVDTQTPPKLEDVIRIATRRFLRRRCCLGLG